MKMNSKRLLNVARALRESEVPKDFTMGRYGNACGTPACALGHYASRRDLQRTFTLEVGNYASFLKSTSGHFLYYDDQEITKHFGISSEDAKDLFGDCGCNDAQTPKRAAQYIERFVKREEKRAEKAA